MMNVDSKLYKQEIEELTEYLRNDKDWEDLRRVLAVKGFDPDNIYLATFFEDEHEHEYGVLVTKDRRVYEYKRTIEVDEDDAEYFHYIECTNDKEAMKKYPQIEIALEMLHT